jgi:hypothetical protein
MRELVIPTEGMLTLVGAAGCSTAGAPDDEVLGDADAAAVAAVVGVVGKAVSGAAEQPASTVRIADTTSAGRVREVDTTGSRAGLGR